LVTVGGTTTCIMVGNAESARGGCSAGSVIETVDDRLVDAYDPELIFIQDSVT
jgi:hypothetical protein